MDGLDDWGVLFCGGLEISLSRSLSGFHTGSLDTAATESRRSCDKLKEAAAAAWSPCGTPAAAAAATAAAAAAASLTLPRARSFFAPGYPGNASTGVAEGTPDLALDFEEEED